MRSMIVYGCSMGALSSATVLCDVLCVCCEGMYVYV